MTEFEHPEDEHRGEDEDLASAEAPTRPADEPVAAAEEPVAAAEEPVAAAEEPVAAAEEPVAAAEEPVAAAEEPVAAAEEPVAAAEEPVAAAEEPVAAAEEPVAAAEEPEELVAEAPESEEAEEVEIVATEDPTGEVLIDVGVAGDGVEGEEDEGVELEVELAPREKPEIPGADLEPDILPEGEEFLDAEAMAAAEAEAEAAAARAEEAEDEARPIADATIDLAAGARYTSTGKRKTAVARVMLKPGTGTYTINSKPLETFFPRETLQRMIRQPLETVGYESRMDVVARMHGGGVAAQAGALRHGISRALIVADPHLRGELKRRGFLTRDPRVKERKKAGLKKARKRPQFSKR